MKYFLINCTIEGYGSNIILYSGKKVECGLYSHSITKLRVNFLQHYLSTNDIDNVVIIVDCITNCNAMWISKFLAENSDFYTIMRSGKMFYNFDVNASVKNTLLDRNYFIKQADHVFFTRLNKSMKILTNLSDKMLIDLHDLKQKNTGINEDLKYIRAEILYHRVISNEMQ